MSDDDFLKKARESLEELGARPRKEDVPLYALADQKLYYLPVDDKQWSPTPKDLAVNFLKTLGFSANKGTNTLSEIQEIFEETRKSRCLVGAFQSGVLDPGLHVLHGNKILVTRGPDKIEPEKGEYPVTDWLLDRLFNEQRRWFEGWLQAGVKNLYIGSSYFSQVLCLVGVSPKIKDLLQNLVISALLGRRSGDAYDWLASKTAKLNDHLCSVMHLPLSLSYINQKKAFDALMLKVAGTNSHLYVASRRASFMVPTCWMPSVFLDRNPQSLACLPDLSLSPQDQDKLTVLDCYPIELEELLEHFSFRDEKTAKEDCFGSENPAYLYRLLHEFEVPVKYQDSAYNIMGFVAPTITELQWAYSEEGEIWTLMQEVYLGKAFVKTELEIFRALDESASRMTLQQFRKSIPGFHSFLERMAKKFPEQIQNVGERLWQLDFT